ncbi:hypothetical protein EV668_3160 [Enterovirga rhinocerotis]|uniref:Uncharacterized protein n=1 Tax=Enterovirga rhinocerotis TaxID=1339210 RepID=A0A4R7BYG8_9HYPH|nr:hypothetical protein EV668_3160 [Enterovirga rhinocerotis]
MSALDPSVIVRDAQEAAALAIRQRGTIRLVFNPLPDGRTVATSPDADWLLEVAWSRESAKLKAMTAILRVSGWCGEHARWQREA